MRVILRPRVFGNILKSAEKKSDCDDSLKNWLRGVVTYMSEDVSNVKIKDMEKIGWEELFTIEFNENGIIK